VKDTHVPITDAGPGASVRNAVPSVSLSSRPARADDAALVHALYLATPEYFDVISIPIPTRDEVRTDLDTAARDERRHIELLVTLEQPPLDSAASLHDLDTGGWVVGYLDYKLDYPERGDATVNLLLVHGALHDRGIGRRAVRDLEARLRGRVDRVLASIYGQNPRAKHFWESLGYTFAIDARPILDWYAKTLA
jgi:ribosomal protein S18 acetylase RimI-like enzyme